MRKAPCTNDVAIGEDESVGGEGETGTACLSLARGGNTPKAAHVHDRGRHPLYRADHRARVGVEHAPILRCDRRLAGSCALELLVEHESQSAVHVRCP
jgi:hypothetical protein